MILTKLSLFLFLYVDIFPQLTRIVLGACNNRIAFVIEAAREYLILMTFEPLEQFWRFDIPQPSDMVWTTCEYFGALRVENDFAYFTIVVHKDSWAWTICNIVHSACAVHTGRRNLRTDTVETDVKHFVGVSSQVIDAFSCANIPQFACLVNRTSGTYVPSKLELGARNLSCMPFQDMDR